MEAQCAGIPVVATAVGGTPEVVPRHLNELVLVGSSIQEIAGAILKARDRPENERNERRAVWRANYAAETNYQQWATELRDLASRIN
jgi:glycosyltransferase involved in cell wall biosynthesis